MSTSMFGGNKEFISKDDDDDVVRGCPRKRSLSRAILVEVGTRTSVSLRREGFSADDEIDSDCLYMFDTNEPLCIET